jgi:hypothetical protein
LPLDDDPADLGRQGLDGMAKRIQVTCRVHDWTVIGTSEGIP